jgi:hypothetical protein
MSGQYLDADTILDARNAYGCGVPLTVIAGHLGVSVNELRRAMDLPQWRDTPANSTDSEPDLFAGFDRLQEQL